MKRFDLCFRRSFCKGFGKGKHYSKSTIVQNTIFPTFLRYYHDWSGGSFAFGKIVKYKNLQNKTLPERAENPEKLYKFKLGLIRKSPGWICLTEYA